MIPELFRIGDFAISPFGLLLVAAFVASYLQLRWGLARLGAGGDEDASAILFAAGFGGIIGAKVYYAALYQDWRLLFDRSGLVWYGGFILGTVAVLWVIHRRRLPAWSAADAVAPALALGYGVGRIGCFLVGDDYGVPTTLPWGVAFRHGLPATTPDNLRRFFGVEVPAELAGLDYVPVHPTQVYETVLALAIWGFGLWLLKRRPAPGSVVLAVFALLACERFAIEFLRAKDDRVLGMFTLAQGWSVFALLVLAALWWVRRRRAAAARR